MTRSIRVNTSSYRRNQTTYSQLDTGTQKPFTRSMALRVLLADESVTIKKAFQLALQDYGVDVVTVNAGVDVVPVAMKFNPDIIFADVLLQKKNGYELSTELKSLDETKGIPVVLIWSGFMDLDEAKFRASKAEAHLEKPFDTEQLRKLIRKLVPRTSTQSLSNYLEFPSSSDTSGKSAEPPDLPEFTQAGSSPTESDPRKGTPGSQKDSSWSMEQFEPMETPDLSQEDEFSEMNLQDGRPAQSQDDSQPEPLLTEEEDETPWVSETLTSFRIDKKKLTETDEVDYQVPEERIDPDTLISNRDVGQAGWSGFEQQDEPPPVNETRKAKISDDEPGLELDLSAEETSPQVAEPMIHERQLEAIIRAQAKEMLEKVIWEVVPEIATQVIERELKKLLQENEADNP